MGRGCWCLLFAIVSVVPAAAQVDQSLAEQYFKEAQALCEREGGRLWGVSLCGPMVVGWHHMVRVRLGNDPQG
jgi:hypothetical protein